MNRNPAARRALGATLRHFRKRDPRDLSQERLAFVAGMDRTFVSQIERGISNPSFEALVQLLQALSVPWEEFGRAIDREPAVRRRPRGLRSTRD